MPHVIGNGWTHHQTGADNRSQVIEAKGLKQVSDTGELEKIVDQILADNAEQVDAFRAADDKKQKKMFGFFVGQAMKATQGKANPQQINQILMDKLKG